MNNIFPLPLNFASQISKKYGRKFLFVITLFTGAMTLYTGWKAIHDSPKNIKASYTRTEFASIVAYSGVIRNEDDLNADDFTFKGVFHSNVAKFDVNTPDFIEKKEENVSLELRNLY